MGRHSALREMRIGSGKTQQAVADQLGVTQSTISNYESGRRCPTPDRLALLISIINRNRATDPAAALESDRRRPLDELLGELAAMPEVFRAIAHALNAGGNADDLNKIGQGVVQRVQQIRAALLDRAPVAGGEQ